MATMRNRTVLKIQQNMNILKKPVEEKNVVILGNGYGIGKLNIFSLIQNKKNNILDDVTKLISKNGQQNSAAIIKPTGTVKVKYSDTSM
ncbi:unnamed protein product [Macrosiphum euphorbiae]|uniref:Uncharacterized protein n=1 Tax=Macrosiphum euphorbiae TaxID=13131 RepID=A0AAV0WEM4_9HEMI|nr:unnamed protein product [Macrosiphum euphorbiae]